MSSGAGGSRLGSASSQRPQSARSRSAWDDDRDGAYDNPGMRSESRQSMGPDDMVAAMEGELYRDDQVAVVQPPVQVKEPPQGCWFKFKKGIRCE